MVFTLIVLILIVVFLAFFVGKNLQNVCTFWFFKTFENLPVAILVLIAFAAGILLALLFVLIWSLRTTAKEKQEAEEKAEEVKQKIKKVEEKTNKKLAKKLKKDEKTSQAVAETDPSKAPTIEAEGLHV